MKTIPEVGDVIGLTSFCYTNIHGGTGLSNWEHDEKYPFAIQVKVTKEWEDYECGQRGWGEPDPNDTKLLEYLQRNAKQGYHNVFDSSLWIDSPNEFVIYWSEFNITDIKADFDQE